MILRTKVRERTVSTSAKDFYPDFDLLEGEEREEAVVVVQYIHGGQVSFESLDEGLRAVAAEYMAIRLTEDPDLSPEEIGRLYEKACDVATMPTEVFARAVQVLVEA